MSPLLDFDSLVIWTLAALVAAAIVLPYAFTFWRRRRADRARFAEAQALGIDRPTAQYPFIDSAHCIGCGSCVRACPEGDVLGVVGGVAVVINGLRCVGHGRCADACPVGAIEIGLGDLKGRPDVPLLTPERETTLPGVFVAGELGGLALIRNAIEQGAAVARTVAERLARVPARPREAGVSDLLIVGAGPAGIATALAAREAGLRIEIVDQGESLGGTLLHFPRRKLVLTRPVALPGGAALGREEYSKEELLDLLQTEVASRRLDVAYGEKLEAIEPAPGCIEIRTSRALHRARFVVLALGRRGTPRKLGVPGEERSKVMYQLRDAESYRGQRILVVGGGDSAIEAAVGLVRQPGTKVTLSYRKNAFYRIKRKNQSAIEVLMERNRVRVLFESEVTAIEDDRVTLRLGSRSESIENDYVFVFAGGEPPFELLRRIGVRFGGDEADISPPKSRSAVVAGLLALVCAVGLLSPARAQQSPHGEKQVTCTDCHDPDRWLPVKKDVAFKHEETGFPLAGQHARLNCTQCHTSLVFTRTATACADCHRDVHSGALGLACERCHDPRGWDNRSEFANAHQNSLFPLLAGHARVDCEACHAGQRADRFVLTPRECVACHEADYRAAGTAAHSGPPTNCVRCHSPFPNSWDQADFQHPARFPLTGEHSRLACSECHKGPAGTTSPDCYSCHSGDYASAKDPNHAAGNFPRQCANCHTTTSWSSGTFDHATTGFLLDGGHRSAACSSCHLNGYAGTPRDCYSCHRTDYDAASDPNHRTSGFPTTCQSCHTTASWVSASFNHATTGFALDGAHRTAACSSCHQTSYAGTPRECYACHKSDYDGTTDPNHKAAAFSTICQNCHSTTSWDSASFDHSTTAFPLQGAHVGVACTSCHTSGYAGTPTTCYACHKAEYDGTNDPDHAASGFPTTCQNCHSQNAWSGASFDHATTGFTLLGAHRLLACSACHASGYAGTPSDCYSCHKSDYEGAENHVAQNYSKQCQNCHNQTTFGD